MKKIFLILFLISITLISCNSDVPCTEPLDEAERWKDRIENDVVFILYQYDMGLGVSDEIQQTITVFSKASPAIARKIPKHIKQD